MAQIFCSTRCLLEHFLLDFQQKFSTGRLVAEKQLPTRHPLESVNIYQSSSSRKIALLDIQYNFYWTRLFEPMFLNPDVKKITKMKKFVKIPKWQFGSTSYYIEIYKESLFKDVMPRFVKKLLLNLAKLKLQFHVLDVSLF